jgi:hypothetical protein
MRRPLVVVFERDGRLAGQLDSLINEKKWVLRESRQVDGCMRHLAGHGPCVLVIRISANAEVELGMLARVSEALPQVHTVVVGGPDTLPGLAGLAWDLGADFAVFPPILQTQLPAIVSGLMDAS